MLVGQSVKLTPKWRPQILLVLKKLDKKLIWIKSNPVNKDTEKAMESVRIPY